MYYFIYTDSEFYSRENNSVSVSSIIYKITKYLKVGCFLVLKELFHNIILDWNNSYVKNFIILTNF